MTDKQQQTKDYKKEFEDLTKKYNDLLAAISDIGFQIQAFAKQNKVNIS